MADAKPNIDFMQGGQAIQYAWTLTQASPAGEPVKAHDYGDRTVQIGGDAAVFDGATVSLQGSNDGVSWFALTDPQGNAISAAASRLETVMETPFYTRAFSSGGGASQNVPVLLFCRRTR